MVYYMDTNTLMKKYSKLPVEVIDKTNFIIISSRIKVTKNRDNVLVASNLFINSGVLKGVGMEMDSNPELALQNFKGFLLKEPKPLSLLCGTIESYLVADENTVFLCSPKEMNCGYMKMIAEAMEDLFHFPVCKYPEEQAFDLEDVLTRVLYYKKEIEKLRIKKMSRVEIRRYIDKLTKKKLKKELKRRKLDYEGLDYEERKALLEERFKEI